MDAYKTVLADLKARRAQLDVAIVAVEQQMTGGGEGPSLSADLPNGESRPDPRTEPSEIRSDSFFGLSIPDAIRKCFRMSKRPLSLSEATTLLKSGGLLTTAQNLMQTVSATLQRMRKTDGDVVSLGKGQWGLSEWYPGLRKEKLEATAKPKKGRKRGRPKGSGKAKAKTGASKAEAKTPPVKPTPEQIEQIRKLNAAGKKLAEIAKEVGLHHLAVWGILKPKADKGTRAVG